MLVLEVPLSIFSQILVNIYMFNDTGTNNVLLDTF